jgi:hypothetical protein
LRASQAELRLDVGRSILTQLIPKENEVLLARPTRRQLQIDRAVLDDAKPFRTEQFHQYYNQGGPSPMHPGNCTEEPDGYANCNGAQPRLH